MRYARGEMGTYRPPRSGTRTSQLTVQSIDARAIPPELVEAWADLEGRALEPNAYLSPHFVLPALRHLNPTAPVFALMVEEEQAPGAPRKLVAVLLCESTLGTKTFPLPHLRVYRSLHSFLTGVLVDRDQPEEALGALLDHVERNRWRWHGLEFDMTWGDGPVYAALLRLCRARRIRCHEWNDATRAVLHPHVDKARIQDSEAAETKSLRRRLKRLQEMGQVTWRLTCGESIPESSVEAFIDLENRGWKGDNKSSLRSTAANERFFRDMVAGFGAAGRALFVEVRVDEKVVASTSNFLSGSGGFAFKIAWNPELAKQSPGRLAEVELLRQMFQHQALVALDFWDSGATEGSYIEDVWPGRRRLVSLGLACSPLARSILTTVHVARVIRRRVRAYQATAAAAPPAAPVNGGAKPANGGTKPANGGGKPARKPEGGSSEEVPNRAPERAD
jgi:hypothetical protein